MPRSPKLEPSRRYLHTLLRVMHCLANKKRVTTREIARTVGLSYDSTRRVMMLLHEFELVYREDIKIEGDKWARRATAHWTLHPEWQCNLVPENVRCRCGVMTTDLLMHIKLEH